MNWFGALAPGAEGYEYHLLAGALALVVAIGGGGAWSLDGWLTRRSRRGEPGHAADHGGGTVPLTVPVRDRPPGA